MEVRILPMMITVVKQLKEVSGHALFFSIVDAKRRLYPQEAGFG
jgi:hypothetical protein